MSKKEPKEEKQTPAEKEPETTPTEPEAPLAEKPKVEPQPVIMDGIGDCRGCRFFPENISVNGRQAEAWADKTKGYTVRPCSLALCKGKGFEAKQ